MNAVQQLPPPTLDASKSLPSDLQQAKGNKVHPYLTTTVVETETAEEATILLPSSRRWREFDQIAVVTLFASSSKEK